MTGKFELHLIVPPKLVGTIVELMDGEGIIVSMNPYVDKKSAPRRYLNGKKNKGISGIDAVIAILTDHKKLQYDKIGKLMQSKHNFAPSTASPVLSKMVKAKKIICEDGFYSLPK